MKIFFSDSEFRSHYFQLLQVLLVTDDAEVRKIVRAANWVRSRLQLLTAVNSVKSMVSSFKVFCLRWLACDAVEVE